MRKKAPTDEFAWTRRWVPSTSIKEIDTWSSPTPRIIEVTQDMGPTLKLLCKEYIPHVGDCQDYKWEDGFTGTTKRLTTPPFAISDVEHAHKTIEGYIERNLGVYLEGYLDSENTIIWESFQIAMSMAGARLDGVRSFSPLPFDAIQVLNIQIWNSQR